MTAVHDHAADDVIISRPETQERLKAATMNDPTRTTKRTFDAEVAQLARQGGGDREGLLYHSFRSSMQRARATAVPPVPGTVDEVDITVPGRRLGSKSGFCCTWMRTGELQFLQAMRT